MSNVEAASGRGSTGTRDRRSHHKSARCADQSEAATAAHNRRVPEIMRTLSSGESSAKGKMVLTEQGEQAMSKLWAKQELKELCPWEQVQSMARQARRV